MNTTIEALQMIYTSLGGEATTVENITIIPEMLKAINGLLDGVIINTSNDGNKITLTKENGNAVIEIDDVQTGQITLKTKNSDTIGGFLSALTINPYGIFLSGKGNVQITSTSNDPDDKVYLSKGGYRGNNEVNVSGNEITLRMPMPSNGDQRIFFELYDPDSDNETVSSIELSNSGVNIIGDLYVNGTKINN